MSIFSVKGPRTCWRCGDRSMLAQSIVQLGVAEKRKTRTGVRSCGRVYQCWTCKFTRYIYGKRG